MSPRDMGAWMRQPARSARFLAARLSQQPPPILCPSTGRVGSTLLWNALVAGRARQMLGDYRAGDFRRVSRAQWDLAGTSFEPGTVCKTHDLPYDLRPQRPLRIVFLFGRPSDVVLSVLRCRRTRGMEWIEDHLGHMHARGSFDDIVDHDILRLEEQTDAWLSLRGADVLSLSYDGLWDNVGPLSDFVGFPVTLPDRVERSFSDLSPDTVERVRRRYAALDRKISTLAPIQRVSAAP